MKKIISVVLAAAMLMMCSVCFADAAQVLRVGTNPEFPPFEYIGDDGNVQGIDVDIMNEIGKDLGMTVEMESMDFDALVPSVLSGKLDAAIAGMTISEDRMKSVLFSDPYFDATQVVIVKADSTIATQDDLKGKKIGVQLGTTGDLMISEPEYEIGEISRYNKGMDAVLDLQNGRLDAVVIDSLPAQQFVLNATDLVIKTDILVNAEVESYGIAVGMENTELVEKINASLKRIVEDGTYDAILVKYQGVGDEEAAEETTDEAAEATEAPAAN